MLVVNALEVQQVAQLTRHLECYFHVHASHHLFPPEVGPQVSELFAFLIGMGTVGPDLIERV